MTTLIDGMTSAEFITALNSNLTELYGVGNFTTITDVMDGTTLQTTLNNNFEQSNTYLGARGSYMVSVSNTNFSTIIHTPTGFLITWVNDYAQIDFTDQSGGEAQHEVYESKNGGAYSLVTTLAAGVVIYNNYTWQNATMNFKIRAKQGSSYSKYSLIVNKITPLVFKTNQSVLTQFVMTSIRVNATYTVNVDWGDGTNDNVTGVTAPLTKDYASEQNPYYITISGDVNQIYWWEIYDMHGVAYGDLSKWILPSTLQVFHWYINEFSGDISNLALSPIQTVFHIAYNKFTGDLSNWVLPSTLYDCHMDHNEHLYGDLSNWVLPGFNPVIGQHMRIHNNYFTKGMRGSMISVEVLEVENNYFDSVEIDAMLVYIDNFFSGGVVPAKNQGFIFTGTYMGIPSAVGLAAKASLEAKYIAQGFTSNIQVNS